MSDALLQSANSLLQLGRKPEALTCYESYLKGNPQSAEAWHNRGITLSQMQRFDEAVASFDKVLALRPDSAQTWSNRAHALFEQKRYEDAVANYDKALALDPEAGSARGYRLLAKLWCCDWRDLDDDIAQVLSRLRAGARVIQPFGNLAISRDPADQLLCARLWNARQDPQPPLWRGERYLHDKIRIAYVSGDFRVHPVSILMAGVFEHHDKSRFETTAISFGHDDGSELRWRIAKSFDRFVDVRGRTDFDIAKLMRELEIDIAVDLMGLTGEARNGILAYRPAPVQVNYLGFPGTTALAHMDYIIADSKVIPPDEARHYSEKIVLLPDTYMATDAHRRVADRVFTRADAGLPETGFVFACFNNSYKFAPAMFDVWMRLLAAVEGSVLWLSEPNPVAKRNLLSEAEKRGVSCNRLVFAPFLDKVEDHLARLKLADLFLDTLPCNAHTTAADALFAGVPVLTTPGTTFAGRVGASLLSAIDLRELIVESLTAYERRAVALAQEPNALADIRKKLAANRTRRPLFDTARFTFHLELAFASMCDLQRRGTCSRQLFDRGCDMSEALLRNAVRLHQAGDLLGAERLYGAVLRATPRHAQALYLLGFVHFQRGQYEDSQRLIGEALALNPQSPDAWYNRGCALQRLNRNAQAVSCFDRAVSLKPDYDEAWTNRGVALLSQRLHERALESFSRALALKPLDREALSNRATTLFELKRYEEAASDFDALFKLAPDFPYASGNAALCRAYACDWSTLKADRERIRAGLQEGRPIVSPHASTLIVDDPAYQLRSAQRWVAERCPQSPVPLFKGERYRHDKIRVAYLSADFHSHATAFLAAGLFETHDKSRFETVAISFGPDDASDMRQRLTHAFDRFIDVGTESDHAVAALIRELEIDIAVDLKGFTQDARPGILALRPVPVQVNYLGHPGTMGAPYIDYLIADRTIIPEGQESHYSESLVFLPDSYQANDSTRRIAERTPARAEEGLPETGLVFCSFNGSFKITPEFFGIWMRLLNASEGSVLWLLDDNPAAVRNLKREAEARGVAAQRLVFAPRRPVDQHLARHRLADLFLDTLPCNAHTTASDALWAGLPLLTCTGTTFAGRVAASLLSAVGLPELITNSLASYEALAMNLAHDPAQLAAAKAKLAQQRESAALFDTQRFTRHLESAFTTMWERQQRGLRPASFAVAALAPP